jgi:hypothetical protein
MSTNDRDPPSADGITDAAAGNTLALNPLVGVRILDLATVPAFCLRRPSTSRW